MSAPVTETPDWDTSGRIGDRVPVPDPTRLTTALVDRALANFREVMETRFGALDKATLLNEQNVAQLADRTDKAREKAAADVERQLASLREFALERIDHVADVASEKISGLEAKLAERDERVKQAAAEAKTSLDAALTAQSAIAAQQSAAFTTANNKQEVAFQKLLDQQAATSRAEIAALQNTVADLKDRLSRAETAAERALAAANTRIEVKGEGRTDNRALTTIGLTIAAIVVTIVIAAFTLRPS